MTPAMTKYERVMATFKHQETDRVPLYDLMLSDACIEYFTGHYPPVGPEGARLQSRAVNAMLDMARGVGCGPREPGEVESRGFVKRYERYWDLGYVRRPFHDEDSAREWLKGAIREKQGWRARFDAAAIQRAVRAEFAQLAAWMDSDDPTVCCLRTSSVNLDWIRADLGLELFSYLDAETPELISEYLELSTEEEVAIAHAVAETGCSPWVLTYTDIGLKDRLLHAPAWLRRELFPRLKRLHDAWHAHGIVCIFHSDGYLMEIMDDLVYDVGIDGINPIEVVAGMDVGELYRRYGDRLILTGGIDMSQLLSFGTPDQVRETCRRTIAAAPRGYFMGSSTEIDNSSRLDNVLAMLESSWGHWPAGARA
jgi:hypothetical protein